MSHKKKSKLRLIDVTNLFDIKIGDVSKYVKNLHKYIRFQRKCIKKLKLRIQKMKYLSKLDQIKLADEEIVEAAKEPTQQLENSNPEEVRGEEPEKIESVQDFLNDIKNAASQFVLEQNFIYEPTSGLYYDPRSGYYYNSEYGLYYDGNAGIYYSYNETTGQFEFHSQVSQGNTEDKKDEIDEDAAIRKILEDGRKSVKLQDLKDERKKRRNSSSDSDSDNDKYYTRRYHSRSRSRSRSYPRHRSRSRSRSRSRGRAHRRSRSYERYRRSRSDDNRYKEDGECDTSDSNDFAPESESHQNIRKKGRKRKRKDDYEEIAKKYPPSLRIIVLETNLDKIDVGKLFLVTYKGGTLGREGDHHVIIPDINVSKLHLKFKYNHKKSLYQVIDVSKNGTILNGVQISGLNQGESQAHDLIHGSILELNQTKLLCHSHDGITTCDDCEPYHYMKSKPDPKPVEMPSLSHKEALKLLQKRYGLEGEKYNEKQGGGGGQSSKNYVDRAEKRRVKIGSTHEGEKTAQASLNTSISNENKGFKMLSKMGWKGESLGKDNSGIKEPVPLVQNTGTSGLGFEMIGPSTSSFVQDKKKAEILYKTQARYNSIQKESE